jgi:hypothetical protein
VPVKNGPYRLFVNMDTLKGAKTNVGETADFVIEQDKEELEKDYPMPPAFASLLKEKNLTDSFNALPYRRRKDILRYLNNIKTSETLLRNSQKVILQFEGKLAIVDVPISLRVSS